MQLVAASGQRVLEEKTARIRMTMSAPMPAAAGGGLMTGTGWGAQDFSSKQSYLTLETDGPWGVTTMKTIMDFPFMYMNMADMMRAMAGGSLPPQVKPWIRANLKTAADDIGIDLESMMQFSQSDAGSYALYTKGVVNVEKLGVEQVRNKPATHYSATLDFEKLLDEDVPDDVRSSVESMLELMGTSEVPTEVWLDSSNRMVRQKMEIPTPVGLAGENVTNTIDMTYFAFGSKVDIDLPPRNKVMDLEELMELTQGNAGKGSDSAAS